MNITIIVGLCGCVGILLLLVFFLSYECSRFRKNTDVLKDQLAMITDHFQALVGYVDAQHRYQYVNKRYAEWYGFTKEEMIGKTIQETLAPEAYARAHPLHEAALRGEHISFENIAPGRDGRQHHLLVDLVPHIAPEGNVKGFLGLLLDISELKQTEEELRRAKEKAEIANHAKSVFLANMSHELRTPLNSILGYAQILQRNEFLTQAQRDGLAIIERSGFYLLDLINDILDLAKVEAGKVELHLVDTRLMNLLESIHDIMRFKTESKQIAFALEAAPTLPHIIRADERRLRQILLNLLGNAVKFTERGVVTLRVTDKQPLSPANQEKQIAWLRFEVEDTGIGMTEDELKNVFEPFAQAGHISYKEQGTGLGLAISRNLVRLMGGELSAVSQPGIGSRFSFEFSAPVVESIESDKPHEMRRIIGIEGTPPRILIVDDNTSNRRVLVDALAPLGFDIREACNGREGWRASLEWRPHAVIIDLRMPEMDGLTLIRQLRQAPDSNDFVLIASSASVYQEDQQQSIAAGAQAFLPKPIDLSVLLHQLQRWLHLTWQYAARNATERLPTTVGALDMLITPERLAALSDDLIERLQRAVLLNEIEELFSILQDIRRIDADLADLLTALAQDFQYGKISKLFAHKADAIPTVKVCESSQS